ncbi:hypothetical protein [Sphingomonas sp. DBB INV C78]|uniref:hypothetical protein n=1 Tax=Sphingomonas sp. DBB INV C78 TaxID=3349434 RepID=UPI0036D326DE
MPTTGEFGPAQGFGDYEMHADLATLLAVSFTHSREDAEAQAGVNDFENSQLRLSDGTLLFSPGAFNTTGQITRATYEMLALSAGLKYRGWTIDGEYYFRWLDNFTTIGLIPVDEVTDQGFQLQLSTMAIPKTLQLYAAGSKIFGDYGDPYDVSLGLNWFPFDRKEIRVNAQAIYLQRSPTGNNSVPYTVGGDGWVFSTDFIVSF